VQKTLVLAFVLVVLVVYLFLGSFRATLIPTLATPVSGTFGSAIRPAASSTGLLPSTMPSISKRQELRASNPQSQEVALLET
jgi:hypothetical protein